MSTTVVVIHDIVMVVNPITPKKYTLNRDFELSLSDLDFCDFFRKVRLA